MINEKKVFAIMMSAGKGTRMGMVDSPKHMVEIAGKPIVEWAIRPLEELKEDGVIDRIVTIVGFFGQQIIDYLADRSEFAWQKELLGTGHAVEQAEKVLGDEEGIALIVNGDHPLFTSKTYKKLLDLMVSSEATVVCSSVVTDRFDNYGRVLRDENGIITGLVEKWAATDEQSKIREKNVNLYAVNNKWLFENLKKIKPTTVKNERYINDIVHLAVSQGEKVEVFEIKDIDETLGINTSEEREEAEKILLKTDK